ncbi:MAG: L-threonylcarbamoyladenylate synthase [Bacteroidota bacterium]
MTIISSDISKAADLLTNGKIVAIPTETVYGLAGSIYNEQAIKKIFATKQRPLFNPLIVHLYDIEQVKAIVSDFPPKAQLLAQHFWPGPLTLILKKKPTVPDLITAGKDTVAVRIPNHPVTLQLLKKLPFPIAAPSANPFNRISPTRATHVEAYFKDTIPMVLEGGECKKGIESTIIGFENDEIKVYRLGSLALEEIEKVVGKVKLKNKAEAAPNAPGMLAKHYAPKTKTILTDNIEKSLSEYEQLAVGILKFRGNRQMNRTVHVEVLSETGDLAEAAANLYHSLHKLDDLRLDIIIAERFPNYGLGKTINDRLGRATK